MTRDEAFFLRKESIGSESSEGERCWDQRFR